MRELIVALFATFRCTELRTAFASDHRGIAVGIVLSRKHPKGGSKDKVTNEDTVNATTALLARLFPRPTMSNEDLTNDSHSVCAIL